MLDDSQSRGGTLVVMGELPTYEMREEVAITYPDWRKRFPRVHLIFWQVRGRVGFGFGFGLGLDLDFVLRTLTLTPSPLPNPNP